VDRLAALPPGLKLAEMAQRLGEAYASVQRWAAFFGYRIRDGRTERQSRVDWSRVRWELPNVVLAQQLGVSRERVRQVRNELARKMNGAARKPKPRIQANAGRKRKPKTGRRRKPKSS